MNKYMRIATDLENKIINVEYDQGEKLPSLRQIMKSYQCSRSTAISAYDMLIKKHLVYVKAQSGYYVADNSIKPISLEKSYLLDTGNPIVSATSLVDAKHCLSIAIEQYSQSSSNISLQGVESLREILPEFLAELGIYAKYPDIYLIQGITQTLSFLTLHPFPNHKETILIEEPTYSYYIRFLKSMNIPVLTIERTKDGINLTKLEQLFKNENIKFFYTIPRNHNPLGTTLNTKTRQKIAKLALQYNVYIIEDDYFAHCSSQSKYLPISYYASNQNCIYLTSFSKIIPYIRIGICVIHPAFQKTFEDIIHHAYYFSYQLPSLISQATFESYLRSSLYKKQVQRLQHQLHHHYQIIQACQKQWDFKIATIVTGTSGYYFSILLHPNISISQLQQDLENQDIIIARNERCFYHKEHDNHSIRLSLARIEPKQLKEALDLIYQTILHHFYKNPHK